MARRTLSRALKTTIQLIADSQHTRVGDSLDLDAASRDEHPNDHRWDYLLSVPDAGRIVGVEPHTARDQEIRVVIAKRQAAVAYLANHLRSGQRVDAWFWVTRGKVGFGVMERARRRLDEAGIAFAGRRLESLDG